MLSAWGCSRPQDASFIAAERATGWASEWSPARSLFFLRYPGRNIPMTSDPQREGKAKMQVSENKVVGACAVCHSVNHLFFESLGPLFPFLIPAFGLSYTEAGRIGFVYYLFYGLSNYPSGHWADRYGRRKMILLFLLFSSGATLLMAFSRSLWQLLLCAGLAGVGGSLYHPPGTEMVSDAVPATRRGVALGVHGSGGSFGTLLAFLIGGGAAVFIGWRIALAILSVVGFLLLAWFRVALGTKDPVPLVSNAGGYIISNETAFVPLLRVLSVFLLIYGIIMVTFKGAYVLMPTYIKDTFHVSTGKAVVFCIIMPLVGIFSNIAMGRFCDRYGRKKSLVIVFLFLSACFFLLFLEKRLFLLPLLVVVGFLINSFSPISNAYTADLIPPELRGKAFGIIFTFSICLSSLSPYIMGTISDRTSLATGMIFLSGASLLGAGVSMINPGGRGSRDPGIEACR
ncbi:MAG: MFS transporter [Candidatus Deferrimicrobium sp.]